MPGSGVEPHGLTGGAPVAPPVLLEVSSISKSFGGVHALEDVDLMVRAGEIAALVGENGAGKSTLVKCITGLEMPDRGEIRIEGRTMRWRDPHDARMAGVEAVHQNLGLADNLDVASNIFLGREWGGGWLTGRKLAVRPMRVAAAKMLDELGVSIPVRSLTRNLSGGQRQLVSVVRATSWGARLVIMDEPTAALGVQETAKVLDVVRSLASRGMGVLIISHNLEQVREISDRVWVLRRGRIVASLAGDEISSPNLVRHITGLIEG